MRSIQIFILRMILDSNEPGTLRGSLQPVQNSRLFTFENGENLQQLLESFTYEQGEEGGKVGEEG